MNEKSNTIPSAAEHAARGQLVVELYNQLFDNMENRAELANYSRPAVLLGVAQMIIHETLTGLTEVRGASVAHYVADNIKRFIDECNPTLN